MLAVPIATYYLVLNALPLPPNRPPIGTFEGQPVFVDNRPWQARGASLGALLGLIVFGWVPFYIWKAQVSRRRIRCFRAYCTGR